MSIFTAERLVELCPQPTNDTIQKIADCLETQAKDFGVDRLLRRAHFIAQIAHESGGFKRLVENLNYSPSRIAQIWPRLAPRADELAHRPEALGNAAYANKNGNGDEASRDGWRFRGRGLIQLTGRDNYSARGLSLGWDLVGSPSLAAEPDRATLIALDYWRARRCNEAADADDVLAVTKIINGSTTGLADRKELTERAKGIFVEQPGEGLIA